MRAKFKPTTLSEAVDFSDCDYISKNITQPLRVQEVNILKANVIIMQQNAIFVKKLCCLAQFSAVMETCCLEHLLHLI